MLANSQRLVIATLLAGVLSLSGCEATDSRFLPVPARAELMEGAFTDLNVSRLSSHSVQLQYRITNTLDFMICYRRDHLTVDAHLGDLTVPAGSDFLSEERGDNELLPLEPNESIVRRLTFDINVVAQRESGLFTYHPSVEASRPVNSGIPPSYPRPRLTMEDSFGPLQGTYRFSILPWIELCEDRDSDGDYERLLTPTRMEDGHLLPLVLSPSQDLHFEGGFDLR